MTLPSSRSDVALFALCVIALALLVGWSPGLTLIGVAVVVWACRPA